jgi:ABC-type multidrug transport system fused ATPase/permease subunit
MRQKYPNLKSLKKFYASVKLQFILFVVFTILASGIMLLFPFTISNIIMNLTNKNYSEMIKYSVVLFALICELAVFELASGYFHSKTTNKLFLKLRHEVAYKLMGMNLAAVYENGSGFFLERLSEDSREASAVLLNISSAIIKLVINLGFIFYITALNPILGAIFAVGLTILVLLEYFRVSRLLVNTKKTKKAIEKVRANENEILKGIKEIKGLNAKDSIIEKHSSVSGVFADLKYKREMYERKMQKLIDVIKGMIDLAILLFAGFYLMPSGMIELAAVLVIYNYKGDIYELIASLAKIKDLYANGELAAKRVNDIIAAPDSAVDIFGEEEIDEVKEIEFKNVAFGYTPEKKVLKNINFKINSNGVYGFVGKSGSGKSTIFSLLANFYKKTDGSILINGKEIDLFTENSIKNQITPVLQDPYIFNDTIYNNIRFARPDIGESEIYEACKKAEIHDEIMEMKDEYQTVIGADGATISGGQKQRIEIARVLLKDTKVLLFDEATSALDKKNLEKINKLIIELGKTKIVFVIAHRLGIMRLCDKVMVLDEGKIIDFAHHSELMTRCEYYIELFKRNQTAPQKTENSII